MWWVQHDERANIIKYQNPMTKSKNEGDEKADENGRNPSDFFSSFHSSNFGPFVLRLFFVCKLSGFISSLGSQII